MPTAQTTRTPGSFRRAPAPLRSRQAATLDEFDAWEGAWRELDSEVACPLSQFNWARGAYWAFADDATPQAMAVFSAERMLAAAPLVWKRVRGVGRLFLAGARELGEPTDLPWRDPQALNQLARVLARGGTPLLFDRMAADSPALVHLRRAVRARAISFTRPRPASAYIELDESWVEPEHHLRAQQRTELGHARHAAEQWGPATTEIHTPDLRGLATLLDMAFDVEVQIASEPKGDGLPTDAEQAVFYRQYAQSACVEGNLRVCFLRIGDRIAAMQLAVEQGGGFWLLKVGSDARFADCSPELLLMRDTIRYAAEAGLTSYEFLGTAEPWTKWWPCRQRPCVSLAIYPISLRGLSGLAADLTAWAISKLRS